MCVCVCLCICSIVTEEDDSSGWRRKTFTIRYPDVMRLSNTVVLFPEGPVPYGFSTDTIIIMWQVGHLIDSIVNEYRRIRSVSDSRSSEENPSRVHYHHGQQESMMMLIMIIY